MNDIRAPKSNIWAASIIGASLIVSALIMTRPPLPVASAAPLPVEDRIENRKPLVAPPLAQESVSKQFRDQVLASPQLRTYRQNGKDYTLSDVKVTRVVYEADKDYFTIRFEWVWKEGEPFEQPWPSSSTLSNDGYGHYYGSVSIRSTSGDITRSVDITVK